ncbi:ribosomal protein S18 acetylase RimI-like enzyme [Natronospira proteinivora]|uniref:Ribosomal protein S18 acetylase RimI-like enzyme n=1 Tax=Natronospira proteinivora TaxID=1807133 RepID=A0ABT1G8U7_9GAMM|nr:N-acetyltransferase [Natronospira proteinivora]MCP1726382.1 ribosomal protein S18 acetylase RimI-like enzyme [Natronospira proteinivora]
MSQDQIKIRPAQPDDAAVIVDFNRQLAQETEGLILDESRVRPGVEAVLVNPSLGRYFISELAGEVVGQIGLTYEWSDWRNGHFWWIQSVYVLPQARRAGVFRALYHHVEAMALEDPACTGLRLYVEPENQRAIDTYKALGLSDAPYRMLELDFSEPERD